MMPSQNVRTAGGVLALLGIAGILVLHWMVWFWVPTEATMGVIQRIFYIHVPSAWVAFLAFAIVAVCSALFLWKGDERLDQVAACAAEGGMVFTTVVLLTGPLWARVAWGTFWVWEPRLTLTLLLWFIYLGYFLVRRSTDNPDRGKRFAAVVGIVGALDIPLIHLSVLWFRSMHPTPVVVKAGGPTLAPQMLATLMVGLLSFTLFFLGVLILRYSVEVASRTLALRERRA
jgi:heme exporter protein C